MLFINFIKYNQLWVKKSKKKNILTVKKLIKLNYVESKLALRLKNNFLINIYSHTMHKLQNFNYFLFLNKQLSLLNIITLSKVINFTKNSKLTFKNNKVNRGNSTTKLLELL